MRVATDDSSILAQFGSHLLQFARKKVCVLDKDEDWKRRARLNPVRGVSNDLRFILPQKTEKVWKAIVSFCIEEQWKKPEALRLEH